MKFYIVKQPLDWFGAVSQYKISLENPSVFQIHSCYFMTSLNNPRDSDVNRYMNAVNNVKTTFKNILPKNHTNCSSL